MSDIRIRKTEGTEDLLRRAQAILPGQDVSEVIREALRAYVGDPPVFVRQDGDKGAKKKGGK